MRRFRRSERGLSEIVGTLMLVVIVVAAATLLAAFVASYQKQLQSEETFSHDQSLESIKILGLTTAVSNGVFTEFDFTLASEYVNPSGILDIYINGNPLLDFAWQNVSTNTYGTYNAVAASNNFIILPFEQVIIQTCLAATCPASGGGTITSSFLPGDAPSPNSYIKFDVFTHLHNDFVQTYLPPTAFAVASEIDPSGNNPLTLLDGSSSFQSGGNASIVNWGWTVTGGVFYSSSPYNSSSDSILTQTTPTLSGTNTYTYTGTGTATFQNVSSAVVPWSTYLGFLLSPDAPLGTYISNSGTGCTVVTASFAATGGSLSGTNATVPFSFVVSFTCTGSPGSVVFSGAGDVTMTTGLVATGEEIEISPVLPVPTSHEPPYSVDLVVTNSDGLAGTATITYIPIT